MHKIAQKQVPTHKQFNNSYINTRINDNNNNNRILDDMQIKSFIAVVTLYRRLTCTLYIDSSY